MPLPAEPRVPDALRETIAHKLLAVTIPGIAVAALVIGGLLPIVDPAHPTRLIPVAVALASAASAFAIRRTGRALLSANVLFVGLFPTTAVAMWFNGGMRAPGSVLPIVVMVQIASLHGRRVTMLAWGAFALYGLAFVVAESRGALAPPPPSTALMLWLIVAVFSAMTAIFATIPVRRMMETLHDLEARTAELARARDAERARFQEFAAAFDQSFQMMGLLDPAGVVLKANATALRFIGAEARTVIGLPFPDTPWWTATQRPQIAAAIRRAAAGERVSFRAVATDAGGSARTIDFSLSPFRDAGGRVIYLIPEGRDITAMTEAEARLQQAAKMDSLGQLAGGVAHDFNNMLTGIGMAVELLGAELARQAAGAAAHEHLQVIRQAADRAGGLTRHLLQFARKDPPERGPVDVNAVVRAGVALLERSIDRRIRIEAVAGAEGALVLGNAVQFENALINLGLNARDAIDGAGLITVTTAIHTVGPGQERLGDIILPVGRHVAVAVRDTGHGMDEATRRRLFEPFFTTKGPGKGTGLGLAGVYGMVGEHGGAIQVESRPGQGSCFTIYLPCCSDPAALADPTPAKPAAVPTGSGRILLVDDEPSLRQMAAEVLEVLGYSVVTAINGRDALERFRAAPGGFDLLIVDMSMPGMSGGELCQVLRAAGERVPIIVATGYANPADGHHLRDLGDVRMLQKPFRVNLLGQVIAETLVRRDRAAAPA